MGYTLCRQVFLWSLQQAGREGEGLVLACVGEEGKAGGDTQETKSQLLLEPCGTRERTDIEALLQGVGVPGTGRSPQAILGDGRISASSEA